MPTVAIPGLSKIPVIGPSLFASRSMFYIGIALIFVVSWILYKTNLGLNIRAAGWKPVALDNAGVDVLKIRTIAVLSTGALAGLGGGYMAIITAGIFVPFMTGGQGFIAIVIAMLGSWAPGLGPDRGPPLRHRTVDRHGAPACRAYRSPPT